MKFKKTAILFALVLPLALVVACNPPRCPDGQHGCVGGNFRTGGWDRQCQPNSIPCQNHKPNPDDRTKVTIVPAQYHSSRFIDKIAQIVANGTEINGTSACAPACGAPPYSPPYSDACEQCIAAASSATASPFASMCASTSFELPPSRAWFVHYITTDRGRFESQPIQWFRRDNSVRYDECGSPNNADYDVDQGPIDDFMTYVATQTNSRRFVAAGARQVFLGEPGERPLFQLKPEARELLRAGKLDLAAEPIGLSAWLFQGGGDDPLLGRGVADGILMVNGALAYDPINDDVTFGGDESEQLKPCRSDSDCTYWGLLCRPSQWGLVCKAPSAP